jgi:NADPH:quinone reductase-like Zn-dependent oxidoreductase
VSDKFPYIGGVDLSGIVTKVGEGVTHVKEGDRVSSVSFSFLEGYAASQKYSRGWEFTNTCAQAARRGIPGILHVRRHSGNKGKILPHIFMSIQMIDSVM